MLVRLRTRILFAHARLQSQIRVIRGLGPSNSPTRGLSALVPLASCIVHFFFNDTATTEIYTLSLHDALPISEPPTEVEYQALIESFFLDTGYVAKFLWRDDLVAAKYILDHSLKHQHLLIMLAWRIKIGRAHV